MQTVELLRAERVEDAEDAETASNASTVAAAYRPPTEAGDILGEGEQAAQMSAEEQRRIREALQKLPSKAKDNRDEEDQVKARGMRN